MSQFHPWLVFFGIASVVSFFCFAGEGDTWWSALKLHSMGIFKGRKSINWQSATLDDPLDDSEINDGKLVINEYETSSNLGNYEALLEVSDTIRQFRNDYSTYDDDREYVFEIDLII